MAASLVVFPLLGLVAGSFYVACRLSRITCFGLWGCPGCLLFSAPQSFSLIALCLAQFCINRRAGLFARSLFECNINFSARAFASNASDRQASSLTQYFAFHSLSTSLLVYTSLSANFIANYVLASSLPKFTVASFASIAP